MSDEKHAVTEQTTPAPAGSEGAVAPEPSLDDILSEYDRSVQQQQQPQPDANASQPQDSQQYDPRLDQIRLAAVERRLIEEDINQVVNVVAGDTKLPKRFVLGWLHQVANERPAVSKAFLNKANNPAEWKKIQAGLQREFVKEAQALAIDRNATEDREAVVASLRAASTKVTAEPPPRMGHMSNAEYRKFCRESFGFDPGV